MPANEEGDDEGGDRRRVISVKVLHKQMKMMKMKKMKKMTKKVKKVMTEMVTDRVIGVRTV